MEGPCKPTPEAAMERTNPARSAGPDAGAKRFWLLFPRLEKVTRPAGRNQTPKQLAKSSKNSTLSRPRSFPPNAAPPFSPTKKKTHTPFGGVRQSVPLARCYLVCMIRSRRISVLIFTRWSSSWVLAFVKLSAMFGWPAACASSIRDLIMQTK